MKRTGKRKSLLNMCGLLGAVSLLSYAAAVVFSPLAYPGYDPLAQAVSDLSAANAPSLALWNRLSSLYNVCEVMCVMMVCVGIAGVGTRLLRAGIYTFAAMELDIGGRLPFLPAQRQRLRGDIPRCYAHGRYGACGGIVYRIADARHNRRRAGRGLSLLRHMRRRCAVYDARRCAWDETRSRGIFRSGRALQRFCRNGLQRRARNTFVFIGPQGGAKCRPYLLLTTIPLSAILRKRCWGARRRASA